MLKICSLWNSTKADSTTKSGIADIPKGAELSITCENTIVMVLVPDDERRANGPVAHVYIGEKQVKP